MPLILRTIRKSRWLEQSFPWIDEKDAPPDSLGDLATKNCQLSVWIIDDEKSNLERVVTALAATRESFSNYDYALFNQHLLLGLNIKIKKTKGITPDQEVNFWHCDLIELSALKLVELSKAIITRAEIERISEKKIKELLAQAVVSGQIDKAQLRESLAGRIDKLIKE